MSVCEKNWVTVVGEGAIYAPELEGNWASRIWPLMSRMRLVGKGITPELSNLRISDLSRPCSSSSGPLAE